MTLVPTLWPARSSPVDYRPLLNTGCGSGNPYLAMAYLRYPESTPPTTTANVYTINKKAEEVSNCAYPG